MLSLFNREEFNSCFMDFDEVSRTDVNTRQDYETHGLVRNSSSLTTRDFAVPYTPAASGQMVLTTFTLHATEARKDRAWKFYRTITNSSFIAMANVT